MRKIKKKNQERWWKEKKEKDDNKDDDKDDNNNLHLLRNGQSPIEINVLLTQKQNKTRKKVKLENKEQKK